MIAASTIRTGYLPIPYIDTYGTLPQVVDCLSPKRLNRPFTLLKKSYGAHFAKISFENGYEFYQAGHALRHVLILPACRPSRSSRSQNAIETNLLTQFLISHSV